MAGIAAMMLAAIFGTAMGLNNTATYMASGVAFVAVSLWVDSRISRRRSAGRQPAPDAGRSGQDAGPALDPDAAKFEG
ncbi:hypothetical protein [Arthrobacter sp. NicSoilB8]|uniref:hypothetical protein n=1 Tax=Arthrobacter sp. NicSoilB8 TaxID=2830998 RepID=UPI001CC6233D|nr:hypothetical protein [Arthrobacter sp. NicSoilB8]BCW73308.1 hypothetical protein NicSoilB8_43520 [Arthrobacter sp. NicSoilB8]